MLNSLVNSPLNMLEPRSGDPNPRYQSRDMGSPWRELTLMHSPWAHPCSLAAVTQGSLVNDAGGRWVT